MPSTSSGGGYLETQAEPVEAVSYAMDGKTSDLVVPSV